MTDGELDRIKSPRLRITASLRASRSNLIITRTVGSRGHVKTPSYDPSKPSIKALIDMPDTTRISGWHAVHAVLSTRPQDVLQLWAQDGRDDQRSESTLALANENGLRIQRAPRKTLDQLAGTDRHQGVVVEARESQAGNDHGLQARLASLPDGPALLLVLDQVQDPRNLGALLRTADAAGVAAVITPADRSAALTPAARKTAAGAAETVPLYQVTNLARALDELKAHNFWLHGLAGEGEGSLFDADLTGRVAIMMGAEGSGLRRLTRKACDGLWRLPMAGSVESLNVSVAGGIALYEAVRQRR